MLACFKTKLNSLYNLDSTYCIFKKKVKEKKKLQKHMCRNVALTFLGHIQYYILTLCSILMSVEWCSKTVVNCWGNKEDFPWSQLVLLYSNISALDCQITVIPLLLGCITSVPTAVRDLVGWKSMKWCQYFVLTATAVK